MTARLGAQTGTCQPLAMARCVTLAAALVALGAPAAAVHGEATLAARRSAWRPQVPIVGRALSPSWLCQGGHHHLQLGGSLGPTANTWRGLNVRGGAAEVEDEEESEDEEEEDSEDEEEEDDEEESSDIVKAPKAGGCGGWARSLPA